MTGKTEFQKTQCSQCHSDTNEDGAVGDGLFKFNVNSWTYPDLTKYESGNFTGESVEDLARFINANMPNATVCTGTCADDVAAYLWSLRGKGEIIEVASCVSEDPVFYGQRALKFLTSYEYHNSMQGLFSSPLPADYSDTSKVLGDKYIASMPNHSKEVIEQTRLDSYDRNAAEVAKWAIENGHDGNCTTSTSATCANWFVDEFAMMAFRRPLNTTEATTYRSMITGSASGLEWAFRSVLMSPQFLYRSELGVKVSAALEDPFFSTGGSGSSSSGGGNADGYEAGAGGSTVNAVNFTSKSIGENNMDGTHNLWATGNIAHSFNFTNPAIIIINAKGNDFEKRWAQMTVTVGGQMIAMEMVEHYELREYRYYVPGVTGNQQLQIAFSNMDEGREPYGEPGNDKNLYIGDVTVAPAVMASTPEPLPVEETDPLMAADLDAYVLDPYEYASALAYIYTGSGPDKALLDAVASGAMADPAQVEMHIDRMLDSDLGRKQVERFAGLWFRTDKVTSVSRDGNPAFTTQVRQSMAQEIREIYKLAFYDPSVPFKDIYRGNFTMLDSTLSQFYGIPGGGGAHGQFAKVALADSNPRGGVIASGAYMATWAHVHHTSPIKRAVHFRQDVLCQAIPLPFELEDGPERDEAGKRVAQLKEEGSLTTTDFYHLQTDVEGSSCAGCHRDIINPLFAIDNFDHYGLPRKVIGDDVVQRGLGSVFELGTDGNADVPIDMVNNGGFLYEPNSVGTVDIAAAQDSRLQGTGIPFSGAKELSRLAVEENLTGVDACLVEKSFRFATGFTLSPAFVEESELEKPLSDEQKEHYLCVSENLTSALNNSGGSPRAMLKALGLSDVIRFRR